MLDVFHLLHLFLWEGLQGDPSIFDFVPCLVDLAKVSDTDDLIHLKVSDFGLVLPFGLFYGRPFPRRFFQSCLLGLTRGAFILYAFYHLLRQSEAFFN